ncbi:MAG: AI-2E family transporter [Clostridia bacterium]|nr:AI-2E family transporter [Clostridia bacterium]
MQHTLRQRKRLPWIIAGAAVGIFLLRGVLSALAAQLAAAYLLMALALPICRWLEKRLAPGLAAACAFLLLGLLALAVLLGVIPPLLRQFSQLADHIPDLLARGGELLARGQAFLRQRGLDVAPLQEAVFDQISQRAGGFFTGAAQLVTRMVQGASKLFLAPLFAFYLLRDRRRIAATLELLIPVGYRVRAVRAAREMRREAVNFFRGQLMLSAAVGLLTAIGLLLTGSPGWLALGLLMGVMELIPYVGPLLAGVPAVLLALQGGWVPALWTLAVLLLVQQIESGLLSPRFLSGATRLHPLIVLLIVSAGGILAGPMGMVISLPAVVSLRGARRGWRV